MFSALGLSALELPASAHARLLESDPANGATLDSAPAAGRFRLSDPVNPSFVTVALTDQSGAQLPIAPPNVQNDTVTQPFPALNDGSYTLAYRIVSADGHPVSGAVSFQVANAAASAPSSSEAAPAAVPPVASPSSNDTDTNYLFWWVGGGALLTILLAVAAVAVRQLGHDK
ncbi:copper resistance CopC family protein [Saccharopolyspora sp. 5N708]|uniref:copper resistance CopC family protein n=1 Tax=Saccharopolyspora sp. 5N708 TaxID=3457424 RepID=UPI003FD298DB